MPWIGKDTNPNAEPVGVPPGRTFIGPDAARNEEIALLRDVVEELRGIRIAVLEMQMAVFAILAERADSPSLSPQAKTLVMGALERISRG